MESTGSVEESGSYEGQLRGSENLDPKDTIDVSQSHCTDSSSNIAANLQRFQDPKAEEQGRSGDAVQEKVPVAAEGVAVPVAAEGVAVPVAAEGVAVPVAAEGVAVPVAAEGVAVPVAAEGVAVPVAAEGVGIPFATEEVWAAAAAWAAGVADRARARVPVAAEALAFAQAIESEVAHESCNDCCNCSVFLAVSNAATWIAVCAGFSSGTLDNTAFLSTAGAALLYSFGSFAWCVYNRPSAEEQGLVAQPFVPSRAASSVYDLEMQELPMNVRRAISAPDVHGDWSWNEPDPPSHRYPRFNLPRRPSDDSFQE